MFAKVASLIVLMPIAGAALMLAACEGHPADDANQTIAVDEPDQVVACDKGPNGVVCR